MDYTGVVFRVFHKGKPAGEFLQEYGPGQLKASDNQPAFLLGSNRFHWEPNGNPPSYTLSLQGEVKGGKKLLRARLFFTPQPAAFPQLDPPEMTSTHTWVLAAPHCRVEGTLQWCDGAGDIQKEEPFVGRGTHDHHFGTVPLDRFVKAWQWGRIYAGDQALLYSVQTALNEIEPASALLFLLDKGRVEFFSRKFELTLKKNTRNFFWLPFFKKFGLTGGAGDPLRAVEVNHPKILSDGPVSLILETEGTWSLGGKPRKGHGMSNYVYAPRLSRKFFFPMLKGKTTVVLKPKDLFPPSSPVPGGDVSFTRPDT
jgi:carotenoid 1,2-hydratase